MNLELNSKDTEIICFVANKYNIEPSDLFDQIMLVQIAMLVDHIDLIEKNKFSWEIEDDNEFPFVSDLTREEIHVEFQDLQQSILKEECILLPVQSKLFDENFPGIKEKQLAA